LQKAFLNWWHQHNDTLTIPNGLGIFAALWQYIIIICHKILKVQTHKR